MIKTFRGKLDDGEEQVIRLSTKKGKIGYKIAKFQILTSTPGASDIEAIVKIFKITQTSVTATIDFSDGNLLASAYSTEGASVAYPAFETVIFEQEIFNQDIFITHKSGSSAVACNYYLELEAMPLTDNAAAVSTLRDIRLNPQVGA